MLKQTKANDRQIRPLQFAFKIRANDRLQTAPSPAAIGGFHISYRREVQGQWNWHQRKTFNRDHRLCAKNDNVLGKSLVSIKVFDNKRFFFF